jgi:hypothetical protein
VALHTLAPLTACDAAVTMWRSRVTLQIMVANGVALVALTLKFPPYFGLAGSIDSSTLMLSDANRLRCAVDLGVLWVYLCSLAATLMYAGDDDDGTNHCCCCCCCCCCC